MSEIMDQAARLVRVASVRHGDLTERRDRFAARRPAESQLDDQSRAEFNLN